MNTPDFLDIDFDAYRLRAEALRTAAIDSTFARVAAALRSHFAPRSPRPLTPRRTLSTHCPA